MYTDMERYMTKKKREREREREREEFPLWLRVKNPASLPRL